MFKIYPLFSYIQSCIYLFQKQVHQSCWLLLGLRNYSEPFHYFMRQSFQLVSFPNIISLSFAKSPPNLINLFRLMFLPSFLLFRRMHSTAHYFCSCVSFQFNLNNSQFGLERFSGMFVYLNSLSFSVSFCWRILFMKSGWIWRNFNVKLFTKKLNPIIFEKPFLARLHINTPK